MLAMLPHRQKDKIPSINKLEHPTDPKIPAVADKGRQQKEILHGVYMKAI